MGPPKVVLTGMQPISRAAAGVGPLQRASTRTCIAELGGRASSQSGETLAWDSSLAKPQVWNCNPYEILYRSHLVVRTALSLWGPAPPCASKRPGMEPRRIVLEPCGLVFALLGFGFITWTYYFFFFFAISPLGNENVPPVPVPPLYFGSI